MYFRFKFLFIDLEISLVFTLPELHLPKRAKKEAITEEEEVDITSITPAHIQKRNDDYDEQMKQIKDILALETGVNNSESAQTFVDTGDEGLIDLTIEEVEANNRRKVESFIEVAQ